MLKTISRLFTIGFLLAMLCIVLQPSLAHAQATTAVSHADGPIAVTTYLQRGEDGGYFFDPAGVTIEANTQLVIVNQTGRDVTLTNNGNFDGVLLRGESYVTAFYSGVYRFSDVQRTVRVPLTITAQGDYSSVIDPNSH